MRTRRALLRGSPWLGVLVVGMLAFGFHSLSASTEQGRVSLGMLAEDAQQPVPADDAFLSAGDFASVRSTQGAGSRDIIDCPGDTIWGQPPTDPDGGWTFATSDLNADPPYRVFEDHTVDGPVCDIHWWGINASFPWASCDAGPNEAFDIEFWDDDGSGIPDISAGPYCSYMGVVPTKVHKGIVYAELFELLYYSLDLNPCCDLQDGWVSIQSVDSGACWFLWASHGETGSGYAYQEHGGMPVTNYDLSVCLTGGGPVVGACCNDSTGVCNDNVPQSQCPPPARFAANTLCADLDPPCGGCDKFVTIDIFTDNWPSETTWELVDKVDGAVVASGGPLSAEQTLHTWDVCVTDAGCYNFTIYDSYGDGICCDYGNGWYSVYHDGLECSGGEFDYSETCYEIGWNCKFPEIIDSNPPDGAIDARQPSDLGCDEYFGWDDIRIVFDKDATEVVAADFTITVDPADVSPPTICNVLHPGANVVRLVLCGRIPPGHWTIFTHDPSETSTRLGFLPADVNGDGTSGPVDILDLIDFINGTGPALAIWQTDIDRSSEANSVDILTEIDVLNGAMCFDEWNGETLP